MDAPGQSEPMSVDPITEDPRPDDLRSVPSLVVLNTGNGKGKSSSAFGVMLRGVAAGWNVAVVQFIKSGAWKVGEETMGRQLGVDWHALGDGFTWESSDLEDDRRRAGEAWARAHDIIMSDDYRLVVLDEITYLCTWGWLDVDTVISTIVGRPERVNVVMTGRDAPSELVELADTVTEMVEVKHAYNAGIRAKRGIDY